MGDWMDLERVRERNGLTWRPPPGRESPYPERSDDRTLWHPRPLALLVGDLVRAERDYLRPIYPRPPMAVRPPGSDPSAVCAREVGVDVATVRAVLAHVFGAPARPPAPADRDDGREPAAGEHGRGYPADPDWHRRWAVGG